MEARAYCSTDGSDKLAVTMTCRLERQRKTKEIQKLFDSYLKPADSDVCTPLSLKPSGPVQIVLERAEMIFK